MKDVFEKHPLPWNADGDCVDDAMGEMVAECLSYSEGTGHDLEVCAQIAVVIATAVNTYSDLYEALKGTAEWLSSFSMPPTSTIEEKQEALARIEAALAKHEGRQ